MGENSRRMGKGLALDDVDQRPKFDLEISIEQNLLKVKEAEMPPDAKAEMRQDPLERVCIYRAPKQLRNVQPPISDWEPFIRENLLKAEKAEMPPDALAKVCIYRVPPQLRNVNPHAFDPHMVSIGPYHRGKEGLSDMDIHKWRCFRRVIGRYNLDGVFLFNSIGEVVSEARRCYEGTIELSDDKLVKTMVLDGCFLLEIFRGCFYGFESLGYSPYDPVFRWDIARDVIRQDVKKLENQVPLFILGRLLGLVTKKKEDREGEVIRLALNFFGLKTAYSDPLIGTKYGNCVHCLDIYRQSLLDYVSTPSPKTPVPQPTSSKFEELLPLTRNTSNLHPPEKPPTKQVSIPCVTKLREAGVEFKKRETNCFFDIKFEAGVLHIPMLVLEDNTRREFPNLIAFERCHLDCSNHVTSYAKFMDGLIDSSDDVAYLHDRSIIDPFGGGSYQATADFFNSIVDQVFFASYASYLSGVTMDLSKEVKRYHESKIRHWTVKIKRMYFTYPWSIISLIAAIFLLVLTFLATYYGMYGYYKPRR